MQHLQNLQPMKPNDYKELRNRKFCEIVKEKKFDKEKLEASKKAKQKVIQENKPVQK